MPTIGAPFCSGETGQRMDSQQQAGGELRERFYRSVAETLALLHAPPDPDRRRTLSTIAGVLASTMDLPLVWIGRREADRNEVEVVAAAGTAAAYAVALKLSADASVPGGRGPVGMVLREERA